MAAGHVDPSITGDTTRQRAVLAEVRKRGLSLHRVHRDGRALRLTGPGVFMTVCDLAALSLSDLGAPSGPEVKGRMRTINGG
jgi:hypothetical protein